MEKRFGTFLKIVSDHVWVSTVTATVTAEKATKAYKILLHNKDFLEKAKEFDMKSQGLYDFYATILPKTTKIFCL